MSYNSEISLEIWENSMESNAQTLSAVKEGPR